jgi:hypothetical protein
MKYDALIIFIESNRGEFRDIQSMPDFKILKTSEVTNSGKLN